MKNITTIFLTYRVKFSVTSSWKGITTDIVDVYTAIHGISCGYPFSIGEEYLVYTIYRNDRHYTSTCSRTSHIDDADDDILALGSPVIVNNYPSTYVLHQNYPNPFKSETQIEYQIPQLSYTRLKVHNVLGEEIAVLINEVNAAGKYKVTFDASKIPSGIYYFRLSATD
ncbi:MAG: T9SS type A sorting domain-containing protein [Bacteroidota bacterium]|nr:T9SS type A sorting domain-containing protein [Bacteroidota bacterium]